MMDGGMTGGDWVWGLLMMVVFWGGLGAVIVLAIHAWGGRRPEEPDAEAILRERFARGEITEDEFEARMRALRARR